jgi:penicillin amidase
MSGSGETLLRAYYLPSDPYNVVVSAVLRMVVDLGDPDKIMAVLPGGVSARLLDPHRTDQVKHFVDGTELYWWFSDQAIEAHKATELKLVPLEIAKQTGEGTTP